MEYAQQLLKDNNMSMTEIYEYIGFANQSALNNALQKKYNLTPRELQKEIIGNKSYLSFMYFSLPHSGIRNNTCLIFILYWQL